MRIAVLVVRQESNSFVRGDTPLTKFVESGLTVGHDMLLPGRDTYLDGFRDTLRDLLPGTDIVPIVRAATVAGPPVTPETLRELVRYVHDGFSSAGPVDAVLAGLHGAFVTTGGHSADAQIVTEIRQLVGPDVPIVLGLDHHGWITADLTNQVDALVAHRTQPHDLYDTATQAASLLARLLRGDARPRTTLRRIPMLTHQERFPTASGPMSDWFTLAREREQTPTIWSISTFPMQPWLDVSSAGWAVTVTGDADSPAVDTIADELASYAWERRHDFIEQRSQHPNQAIDQALRHARTPYTGLAVLADLGDVVFGGAHGDSTELLRLLLTRKLPGHALVPVTDPETAVACHDAGVGVPMTVTVGGKLSYGESVTLHGVTRAIASGRLALPGFIHETADVGRCVLLESTTRAGSVLLMITERSGVSGNHPHVYERLGVDVSEASVAVLKSAANVQGFAAYLPRLFPADTSGSTQSDLLGLSWNRRPTPLFPFEAVTDWTTAVT